MITNEKGGTKYPQTGGTGENTPFAVQSRKKERDNDHDTARTFIQHKYANSFFQYLAYLCSLCLKKIFVTFR